MIDMKHNFGKYSVGRIGRAIRTLALFVIFSGVCSCNDDFLDEKILASLSTDVVLSSKTGFNNYLTALHFAARDEMVLEDSHHYYYTMQVGTDVATSGLPEYLPFRNYQTYLTPTAYVVGRYWQWAYQMMLNRANTLIVYANKPETQKIWANENEKNAVIAEAKFFRAYTYNFLGSR
jgi:starch-binding outer membrane protein, SusD/RagB family